MGITVKQLINGLEQVQKEFGDIEVMFEWEGRELIELCAAAPVLEFNGKILLALHKKHDEQEAANDSNYTTH